MASVVTKPDGTRYIQLAEGENPNRPKITVGKCREKDARACCLHIERLIRRSIAKVPDDTTAWLNAIPPKIRKRLEALQIAEPRRTEHLTVSAFVKHYIDNRTSLKNTTLLKLKDVQRRLNLFFGDDRVDRVTIEHAEAFRAYLKSKCELSENTTRRHIAIAKQFFNDAIEKGLIAKNPFRKLRVTIDPNEARFFYVTPEIAQAVLGACPDAHWRLIWGLARWGGLRVPSEVVTLKWKDVDFERLEFRVHSPKTAHHSSKASRVVPMFPQLEPLFRESFEQAPVGAVYCLDRYGGKWTNLGVHMSRIIEAAGIETWQKLFQNCRSTRETELFRETGGDVKTVSKWLGNSPVVALKHYDQSGAREIADAAKDRVLKRVQKKVCPDAEDNAGTMQNESQNPASCP